MSTNCKISLTESFLLGSISSTATCVIYQPLELLKTRIQLQESHSSSPPSYLGRLTKSAVLLSKQYSFRYLWRGTAASLLRSVPGVGLYYTSLNLLQTSLSSQNQPDNPTQAFYFGLLSRSLVSFIFIPVSVVKVRYESGLYNYTNLFATVTDAYMKVGGWRGISPTILRDSLFSGIFYMSYTKLKGLTSNQGTIEGSSTTCSQTSTRTKFMSGCISGILASVVTNPFDVIKTNIQACDGKRSMRNAILVIVGGKYGYLHLFDGLAPRTIRRTLIAATTWTLYECLITQRLQDK